jgi:hypothetical protein
MGTKEAVRLQQLGDLGYDPALWTFCEVCGGSIKKQYVQSYMGKQFCPWCKRRGAYKTIRMLVFTEAVAKKDCTNDQHEWVTTVGYAQYCRLDCKCIPCTARKVLRI